jgi:hypothetical protein
MVASELKLCYWRHNCPAEASEQGDDEHYSRVQQRVYAPTPTFGSLSSLYGKACSRSVVPYRVTAETVLCNSRMRPVRTLGGRNLFPRRLTPERMYCCYCKARIFTGHKLKMAFNPLRGKYHDCFHAKDYCSALAAGSLSTRFRGCQCRWLNVFGEDLLFWLPDRDGRPSGEVIPNSPWWLDDQDQQRTGRRSKVW